ncbi:hypothetical protein FB451DRAFT_1407903 [Mycena latifolia]|nr:hypothetical protein FB451DRAFT_1407903 [Mycena latifolia]
MSQLHALSNTKFYVVLRLELRSFLKLTLRDLDVNLRLIPGDLLGHLISQRYPGLFENRVMNDAPEGANRHRCNTPRRPRERIPSSCLPSAHALADYASSFTGRYARALVDVSLADGSSAPCARAQLCDRTLSPAGADDTPRRSRTARYNSCPSLRVSFWRLSPAVTLRRPHPRNLRAQQGRACSCSDAKAWTPISDATRPRVQRPYFTPRSHRPPARAARSLVQTLTAHGSLPLKTRGRLSDNQRTQCTPQDVEARYAIHLDTYVNNSRMGAGSSSRRRAGSLKY